MRVGYVKILFVSRRLKGAMCYSWQQQWLITAVSKESEDLHHVCHANARLFLVVELVKSRRGQRGSGGRRMEEGMSLASRTTQTALILLHA